MTERAKFFASEFREYFLFRNVRNREWTLTASSFGIRFPFWTSYPSGGRVWSFPIVAIFCIPCFWFDVFLRNVSIVFQSIFSWM